jgi:hypothetical protein
MNKKKTTLLADYITGYLLVDIKLETTYYVHKLIQGDIHLKFRIGIRT